MLYDVKFYSRGFLIMCWSYSQEKRMKSKQEVEFNALLSDGLGYFEHLNLYEKPSSQELWQEIIEDIYQQKKVESAFE